MKTTNIYYIIDTSVKTRGIVANRIKQNITKVARALEFCPYKTKLHIIGYNDKAFFVHPFNAYLPHGNPDFGEGLKMLENVMSYGKNTPRQRLVRCLYGIRRITFWNVGNRHLKGYSIRKSLLSACATLCITATPTSTRNRRIIALRKPPTKSYATSRKVAYVALYATFNRAKTKKSSVFPPNSFFAYKMFTNVDILLTFSDTYAII